MAAFLQEQTFDEEQILKVLDSHKHTGKHILRVNAVIVQLLCTEFYTSRERFIDALRSGFDVPGGLSAGV